MASTNSFRKSMVWLVMLALLVPGLALAQAACCEPELAKTSDCCGKAMAMPQMNAEQMRTMESAAGQDGSQHASEAAHCSPIPESEMLEWLVPVTRIDDGSTLLAIDSHPAALIQVAWGSSPEGPHSLLIAENPPRAFLPDPLNSVLRI